ncbi:MAG: S41 family peptidase [Planctomycetota bacterium]|jgi:hypothetical protein
MQQRPIVLLIAALVALLVPATATLGQHAKLSPFDGVRFVDGMPEVELDGTWYEPLQIDGRAVTDIMDHCRRTWPGKAEKRFAEDLVEVLTGLGRAPAERIALHLRVLGGETTVTMLSEMTAARRAAILAARNATRPRPSPGPDALPGELTPEQVRDDLDALRRAIDEDFAYRNMRNLDVDADPIWTAPERTVPTHEHAARIQAFINRFGDGHAGVRSRPWNPAHRSIPVLFFEGADGIVATRPDQRDLLVPGYPYVEAMDGVPVERWLEVAEPHVMQGSPQLIRQSAIRSLRTPTPLRAALDLPTSDEMVIALATGDRQNRLYVTVRLSSHRPGYDRWPLRTSERLDDNVGYLRIAAMNDEWIGRMHQTMWTFRDTDGLIIDVRGNGGGSRGILRSLWGYLMDEDDAPTVANIAQYRLSPRFPEDHLANRGLFRADDDRWSEPHRAAIAAAAASFVPTWTPDPDAFSPWHYLVLDRTGDIREYHYDKPVIVLCDTGCFSATDVFLGALTLHPNVTLVGRPSGGGSARSVSHVLPGSGLRIRLASMASFRPDGRPYDGRGVEVDVDVMPTPGYFIGTEDPALDRALQILELQAVEPGTGAAP